MEYFLFGIFSIGVVYVIRKIWVKKGWKSPSEEFPLEWKEFLSKEIKYYNFLNPKDKALFEFKIQEFLLNVKITGVSTAIDFTDKLLVAVSVVAPIFAFPKWQYTNLTEVLIYPNSFNEEYQTEGKGRNILGMVGTGIMNGKMILSKKALEFGFENGTDKHNTAIHEFVHLLDKADGATDGLPQLFLDENSLISWGELVEKEIGAILANKSDIDVYGATNKAEFFAVASEYFFERPRLLSKKHPELYKLLSLIFHNDMQKRL